MTAEQISLFPNEIFGVKTNPAKSAWILGNNFGQNILPSAQIYLQCIHCYCDLNSAKLLANAPGSSCLDYCNSLLSSIADTDLTKLKRVQNWPAHIVAISPSFICSVPLLRSLRLLPVKFRVYFKICLLTCKTCAKQPVHLHSMLATSLPSQSLRS